MAKQRVDVSQVRTPLQQVGGKTMTQHLNTDALPDSSPPGIALSNGIAYLPRMCYHKQDVALKDALIERYRATMPFDYEPVFYENGFDFKASPIITNADPDEFQSLTWGLIPWWMKSSTVSFRVSLMDGSFISIRLQIDL